MSKPKTTRQPNASARQEVFLPSRDKSLVASSGFLTRNGAEGEGNLQRFPPVKFYHIAEPANLASIKLHGLLSAERLVRRTSRRAMGIGAILSGHRAEPLFLRDGVVIRDQKPMPPNLLAPVLRDGMTPSDWYRLLNGFVFLWASEERVNRHLSAFKGKQQVVLTFDARRLLTDLGHRISLSPINSGNARRNAVPRSQALFTPYRDWLSKGWSIIGSQQRPRSSLPAEVVVEGHLPLNPYLIDEYLQ